MEEFWWSARFYARVLVTLYLGIAGGILVASAAIATVFFTLRWAVSLL